MRFHKFLFLLQRSILSVQRTSSNLGTFMDLFTSLNLLYTFPYKNGSPLIDCQHASSVLGKYGSQCL